MLQETLYVDSARVNARHLIRAGDLAQNHARIFLLAQNLADRATDLGRREHLCRYLIKKRLKER
jgi:hypothetical protein